jgi:DNA-binding Lrp family transcriptional regulator
MNRKRDSDMKLISELLKNSRRSDRELAKAIGISQPTVTRNRIRLEKEGYLREYTVVPDFRKLGFELASFNLVSVGKNLSKEELEKAQQTQLKNMAKGVAEEIVLFNKGMGEGHDAVVVAFHKSYSDYTKFVRKMEASPLVDISRTSSFIVNLADETQYRYLTFSTLAKYLLTMSQ